MAQYNFRGKKVTLDDHLVKDYIQLDFGEDINERTLRYLFTAKYPSISDSEFEALTDKQVSDTIAHNMALEIRANR